MVYFGEYTAVTAGSVWLARRTGIGWPSILVFCCVLALFAPTAPILMIGQGAVGQYAEKCGA